MKKYLILLTVLCMTALLAFGVMAEPADDFAVAVLSANGVEQPEANVTQAELDAVVNRLIAVYGNSTPDVTVGSNETFVTRAAVVKALYDAVNGKYDLTAINNVTKDGATVPFSMHDVNDASYLDAAKAFLQAGIITGYDEYGSIGPNKNVKRYELAIMVDRILNPAERVRKDYILYASDEPFYLIDDFLLTLGTGAGQAAASGWRYDYTGTRDAGSSNAYRDTLEDYATDDSVSMSRFVETQGAGIVVFESISTFIYGNTINFHFLDADGVPVVSAGVKNGTGYVESANGGSFSGTIRTKIVIDLDDNVASMYINGQTVAENVAFTGTNIAKVELDTGLETTSGVKFTSIHMYKNYEVNDVFRTVPVGSAPLGYTVTGTATVEQKNSNPANHDENNSLKMTADSTATKEIPFEKSGSGKIAASAFVLAKGAKGTFKLQSGGQDVVTAVFDDGVWTVNNTQVYTSNSAVWQQIRIEADLNEKTALIKVNGKVVAENFAIDVKAKNITAIKLEAADGDVWFDDIKLFQMHDYDDYVPTPVPLTRKDTYKDWTLSMSVCNLWRNGSHFGWNWIAPYSELEPITGYYDEGNPEAMDWEIKFLVEHGITNYALCWYPITGRNSTAANAPRNDELKKSRMSDALQEGFFNAKYSDMMTFNLMFENSGYNTAADLEDFKNNVWPYLVEWYFKDSRYLTIDGKVVFTVYVVEEWISMCGSTSASAELVDWMRSEVTGLVRDDGSTVSGMIFNFGGSFRHEAYENHKAAGGENVIIYSWGYNEEIAYNTARQKYYATKNMLGAQGDGIGFVAVPAMGFNDMAWRDVRTGMMSKSNFKTMIEWYASTSSSTTYYKPDEQTSSLPWIGASSWINMQGYMYEQNSSGNMDNFIQFDTWNEYGEGHYMYPMVNANNGGASGYDYLDAVAEVFGNHDASLDIIPTAEQKMRVSHLYRTENTSIIARELLDTTSGSSSTPTITIEGAAYTTRDSLEVREANSNGEIYLAAQNLQGLYQKLHIVYDWNKTAKTLTIETPNGTVMTFTNGSTTAVVNGANKTLTKAFSVFDGAPVLPLMFVLREGGYEYTQNGLTVDVSVVGHYKGDATVIDGNAESSGGSFTAYKNNSQDGASVVKKAPPSSSSSSTYGSNSWYHAFYPSWNNIEWGFDFEYGLTYTLDFDIYIEGFGEDKAAGSQSIVVMLRDLATETDMRIQDNIYHTEGDRTFTSGKWYHVTTTFTPSPASIASLAQRRVAVYVNPLDGSGTTGASFYIDNVVIK